MTDSRAHVRAAISTIRTTVELFGFSGTCLSFNGGKDSTLLLHLVMEAFPDDYRNITFVYFRQEHEFPQVEDFIDMCDRRYGLSLQHLGSSYGTALEGLLSQTSIKAIFMGTRRGDPKADTLETFAPSDPGWPTFMRVHPVLDWTYAQVWEYLRDKPYCSLYDKGYTSIGNMLNTVPNPRLRLDDGSFLPAYMLEDGGLERCGREAKKKMTTAARVDGGAGDGDGAGDGESEMDGELRTMVHAASQTSKRPSITRTVASTKPFGSLAGAGTAAASSTPTSSSSSSSASSSSSSSSSSCGCASVSSLVLLGSAVAVVSAVVSSVLTRRLYLPQH
ncbi:hypothetical protein PTSG_10768 [Salpingoeca rosetta]|uniref:FAD synthase n=1 Tax=Salpingoeca rosetta (strain ATCC 50818 / BSB-021) TaxID=946362 RepID=F2UQB5_SALR5|nr:uncharacterized protein PTSG_10768 [Salpingoeca rosetta]EGD79783.1 hypothetical protein PTSG_10768 [Salpingoeca rosetta]|eukprot:XP_004988732.1 hypothetical protein PTSG_10768 [Salpingoeca rosetta]